MSQTVLPHIYLVRHGETEWSLSGQHTSRTDLPLLPQGEQAARKLSERLGRINFKYVYSSPRQRAYKTCELAGFSKSVKIEQDLAEWEYGDYEGMLSTDIRKKKTDWNIYRDGCPNGESPKQISDRVDRLISRLRTTDGNVLIFSHGHLLRILATRWIGLTVQNAQRFLLNTASVSVLGYDHNKQDEPNIVLWNDTDQG